MKVPLPRLLSLLALLLCASTAAYAQATIADCEKIQAADAYNQCLAKFGPPAKTLNVEAARPGDVKSGSSEAAAGAGKAAVVQNGRRPSRGKTIYRRGRGSHAVRPARGRPAHGRKRMSISVGR